MTDKLRQAAQQALTMIEATLGNLTAAKEQGLITGTIWFSWDGTLFDYLASEAEALRAALAEQPAIQCTYPLCKTTAGCSGACSKAAPQPAKREPLTREQAMEIVQSNPDTMTAIRMTEAAHGIGDQE